ncbi:nucleotidyltransferase domain-containing protein [bacterium]|nr:nucleotidyltransferase domain-containing protein [FCB group bacterium]MBL7191510.1 nucleotidyltransferase domain-containing protein [bacterium]
MDKNDAINIIRRYREALEGLGVNVEKIILFGSFATGTYHEGSDIDLVVISKDFSGKGFWDRIHYLAKALRIVFEPIEATGMTPEEYENGDSMIALFAREGEVVG